jgi:uncharacterized protein YbaA (DUF1428 family)
MKYVDGFVICVPKKNIKGYTKIATTAGKVWMKHGALEYRETIGDDLKIKFGVPFPKMAKTKPAETVIFSWIVYKSKAHRDSVNKKVMKDPAMKKMMEGPMVMDCKRMAYGGFKTIVDMA